MKPGIEHGVGIVEIDVTDEMVARLDGRVIHPVYSTFWLAYHAEVAARRAIEPYFDEDDDAVGAAIELHHRAMAPIGAHVTIEARVVSVNGARIRCAVTATLRSDTILAEGTQDQVVLPKKEIEKRINMLHA